MNWDAITGVAEMIGALGVIASLIYLATQIRHNTRIVRAGTYESLAQGTAASNALLISDPEVSRIVTLGFSGEKLEDSDRARFTHYLRTLFRRYDSIFFHYQEGILPADAWEGYCNALRQALHSSNVQRFWLRHHDLYTPRFCELVDNEIQKLDGLGVT